MKKGVSSDGLSRRDFLRHVAGTAAAIGASGLGAGVPAALAAALEKQRTGMKYRVLGRTKLKVSELGMGTIITGNAAVIQRAVDLGINYFDTAECYREGNGEIELGKALKGRRDKVVVATKWHTDGNTPAKDLLASLDGSLKRLDMDHVDLIQIHGAETQQQVESDELWHAFTTARDQGKARFNGFSAHGHQAETIRAAIKTGRYDAVLPGHNALTADSVGPAIAEAHAAGIGVIVMKALAPVHEGKASGAFKDLPGSPYQQAIRWVLRDANVATTIVDMPNFDELTENYQAVATPGSGTEMARFEAAVGRMATGSCHLCGACTGQCSRGLRVADIMRYLLYHDGYGDRTRAAALYRELTVSAAACADCASCSVACPWRVPVRARLERAQAVLA